MPGKVSGRRYGQAIFELAQEQGGAGQWGQDVALVAEAFTDPDFNALLKHAGVPAEDKRSAVDTVLGGVNPMVRNMVNLLVARGLVDAIPEACEEYAELLDRQEGRQRVGSDHRSRADRRRTPARHRFHLRPHPAGGGGDGAGGRGSPRRPGHPDWRPPAGRQRPGAAGRPAGAAVCRFPLNPKPGIRASAIIGEQNYLIPLTNSRHSRESGNPETLSAGKVTNGRIVLDSRFCRNGGLIKETLPWRQPGDRT